jgi:glycerophosphoryl diester phosphodiesterase
MVEVVCHRGANNVAPENTRAAAQQCIDWGVHYIEIDVRTSKDGVMYILHDPTVNRTTNGKGLLRDLTSDEIDRLDAGSWYHTRFAGERIPRLEPYLRWIKGKAKIFFDVKDADLHELVTLVRKLDMAKEGFFWFDKDANAREFRKLAPDLTLKINATTIPAIEKAQSEYQASIIELGLNQLTPEILQTCRTRGIKVMVLQKPRDLDAYRKIIELGADMINLDFADAFLAVEREMSRKALP